MKNILGIVFIAAMSLLGIACTPENGDGGKNEPAGGECYEFALDVHKGSFTAGKNGVSINIIGVEKDNIVFELKPGSSVKSYRMEVYPKALLYNELLNRGLVDAPADDCEDAVADLLSSATSGTSVHLFNGETEDFAAKEFDWENSMYNNATILSDCDYMIMVLPFYDEDGQVPAPVCISEVTTKLRLPVGDPQMEIESVVGHTEFVVKYHPNEDCRYFYHWIWSTEEIGEYIDLFGERMMRDFCRVAGGPYDATDEAALAVKRTTDMRYNTAVAVAVDENLTPSAVLVREDFVLLDKPESGSFEPEVEISAGQRISATMACISVDMKKSSEHCHYRLYKSEEADRLMNATDEEKEAEAQNLAVDGWYVFNPNFGYDHDSQQLTGAGFKTDEQVQFDLEPDTEYVIAYVGKNRFGELSPLKFSTPFRTKPMVRDNPAACEADVALTFTEISRWGVKYNFTYDFSKTMGFRFQIVWPFDPDDPTTDEDDAFVRPPHLENGQLDFENREAWLYFLIDAYVEGPAGKRPVANLWEAEPGGFESLADFGYESGTEYIIAYCAEDVNGVMGPVNFVSFTTTEPNPGPNPRVSFEDFVYDPASGALIGTIVANEDSKMLRYFVVDSNSGDIYNSCGLPYLTMPNGRYTYDNYMSMWKLHLIESGLSTSSEKASIMEYVDPTSDNPVLIAALSIGEDNQEDVYSPVESMIFYKGELYSLSAFRTPPTE